MLMSLLQPSGAQPGAGATSSSARAPALPFKTLKPRPHSHPAPSSQAATRAGRPQGSETAAQPPCLPASASLLPERPAPYSATRGPNSCQNDAHGQQPQHSQQPRLAHQGQQQSQAPRRALQPAAGKVRKRQAGRQPGGQVLALGEATNTSSYWMKRQQMQSRIAQQRERQEAIDAAFNHYDDGAGAWVSAGERGARVQRDTAAQLVQRQWSWRQAGAGLPWSCLLTREVCPAGLMGSSACAQMSSCPARHLHLPHPQDDGMLGIEGIPDTTIWEGMGARTLGHRPVD